MSRSLDQAMRLFVALIAIACLVARWGDAACGCAVHHRWASSSHVAERVAEGGDAGHCHDHNGHGHHHEGQEPDVPAGPVIGHGCDSHAAAAVYAAGDRLVFDESSRDRSLQDAVVAGASCGNHRSETAPPGGLTSRALLNVYRI